MQIREYSEELIVIIGIESDFFTLFNVPWAFTLTHCALILNVALLRKQLLEGYRFASPAILNISTLRFAIRHCLTVFLVSSARISRFARLRLRSHSDLTGRVHAEFRARFLETIRDLKVVCLRNIIHAKSLLVHIRYCQSSTNVVEVSRQSFIHHTYILITFGLKLILVFDSWLLCLQIGHQ